MDEEIILVDQSITKDELKVIALNRFGDLVKAVVDIERGIMALGAEMHADEEAFLLKRGSEQSNLWGINLYPDLSNEEMVEFDSMINIRPRQNNRSRSIENQEICSLILEIVNKLVID